MTDKKEQARKLREAADVLKELGCESTGFKEMADQLDPPEKELELWERVRIASQAMACTGSQEKCWKAAIAEANKGMVSKEVLKRMAPWSSKASETVPLSPYDQGIAIFLRVIESL